MHEYLDTMKRYFDNLLVAGFPMDMCSFVSHVTAGLDDEYTPIVCVIRSQNMTWSEIQLELYSFEQRLERLQALKDNISVNLSPTNLPSVNMAQAVGQRAGTQPQNSNHYNQNQGFASNQNSNQQRGYPSNRGNRYRASGRYSPYPPNNIPICHLCGKMGHTVVICYHRYDKTDVNALGSTAQNSPPPQQPPPEQSNGNPTTLMAYLETLQDPSWYLDSGASNHVTTDLANYLSKVMICP